MKTTAIKRCIDGYAEKHSQMYPFKARAELAALTARIAVLEACVRELELGLENDGYSWTCPHCALVLVLTEKGMNNPQPTHEEAEAYHREHYPNCPSVRAQAELEDAK